jgi:hypothetical protein
MRCRGTVELRSTLTGEAPVPTQGSCRAALDLDSRGRLCPYAKLDGRMRPSLRGSGWCLELVRYFSSRQIPRYHHSDDNPQAAER